MFRVSCMSSVKSHFSWSQHPTSSRGTEAVNTPTVVLGFSIQLWRLPLALAHTACLSCYTYSKTWFITHLTSLQSQRYTVQYVSQEANCRVRTKFTL